MRLSPALPVVLAAVTLLAGCDNWLSRPSLYNTVRVVVTQRNGDPIDSVPLVLYTGQRPMGYGITGASGTYEFNRVPQGFYGVRATPPAGYDLVEHLVGGTPTDFQDHLIVAKDTLSPVHFTLLKIGPGTVVARVADAGGAPLSGVRAVLYSPTRQIDSALTDASGIATFKAVPFGAYGVSITRPVLYQSYARPQDSLYAFHDGLVVDDGSRDSVSFPLQRCSARIRFHVTDQNGNPVYLAMAAIYTSTAVVEYDNTDPSGAGVSSPLPCATGFGVQIYPAGGYSIAHGRGIDVFDGIFLSNGQTLDLNFKMTKSP